MFLFSVYIDIKLSSSEEVKMSKVRGPGRESEKLVVRSGRMR